MVALKVSVLPLYREKNSELIKSTFVSKAARKWPHSSHFCIDKNAIANTCIRKNALLISSADGKINQRE